MQELGLMAWAPQFLLGVGEKAKTNSLKILLLGLLAYIVLARDIDITFSIGPGQTAQMEQPSETVEKLSLLPAAFSERTTQQNEAPKAQKVALKEQVSREKEDLRANTFSNLGFILNPTYAKRHGVPNAIVAEKLAICQTYIDDYAAVAQQEMDNYGIPASITLAQGLLESNAGGSKLSKESNNHFGIKCRSKCRACTCRNYTDDDIYDMFRVFDSSWQSFREHSKLLTSARYKHLLKLGTSDYKAWAFGLKKAGYATDKRYAEKLIRLIEKLELDRYDR